MAVSKRIMYQLIRVLLMKVYNISSGTTIPVINSQTDCMDLPALVCNGS